MCLNQVLYLGINVKSSSLDNAVGYGEGQLRIVAPFTETAEGLNLEYLTVCRRP
jgi:hypothetical protein